MPAIALTKPAVTVFDNYGTRWSTSTGTAALRDAEQTIANALGGSVEEWNVTDPAGRTMRIVRISDPDFLDTILAIA